MDTILQFDHSLIFYVHDHLVYSFLTPIMAFISKITGSGALWIVIALLLMLQKKYRVLGVAIIIALGFVLIIGDQGLKPHVARLRPFVDFPNVTVPLESALSNRCINRLSIGNHRRLHCLEACKNWLELVD